MSAQDFNLDEHLISLFRHEPFYAKLAARLAKVRTNCKEQCALGYNLESHEFTLHYDPAEFAAMEPKERLWLIKHELLHLALGHCVDRRYEHIQPIVTNVGMDAAINSLPSMLEDCPATCICPGRPTASASPLWQFIATWPQGESSEVYINLLLERQEEHQDELDDLARQYPSHQLALDPMGEAKMRDMVEGAVQATVIEAAGNPNAWGSVPQVLRDHILAASAHKLDPRQVLRYLAGQVVRSERTKRWTKVNKRYPYQRPGRRQQWTGKVLVSVDQSGSVGDDALAIAFSWIGDLTHILDVTVAPFDAAVAPEHVFTWKKGQPHALERVACGGTDFDAPTAYANANKFDLHVVITDMCADRPGPSKCRRVWLTTAQNAKNTACAGSEPVLVLD